MCVICSTPPPFRVDRYPLAADMGWGLGYQIQFGKLLRIWEGSLGKRGASPQCHTVHPLKHPLSP